MKKEVAESVAVVSKEELIFLKHARQDNDYTDFLVKQLLSQLAERVIQVLLHEREIVAKLSDLRVGEYIPTNSVEYRRQIDALYKAIYEHEDKNINLSSEQPEWIKMSDADGEYWACNVCGEALPRITDFDPQFDLFPRLKSIDRTNFCPNCGAPMHMRERKDND